MSDNRKYFQWNKGSLLTECCKLADKLAEAQKIIDMLMDSTYTVAEVMSEARKWKKAQEAGE